jgi:opacity protein-like surface antigen
MRRFALSVAAPLMASSIAFAADLPQAQAPELQPTPMAFNWSGFYFGGFGGFDTGSSTKKVYNYPSGTFNHSATGSFSGPFAGLNAGYDWLFSPHLLVGIGADVSADDITSSSMSSRSRTTWGAGVTGRIGYATGRFLIYADGGWGWSGGTATILATPETVNFNDNGPRVGAGIDYAITQHWTIDFAYSHSFNTSSTVFPRSGFSVANRSNSDNFSIGAAYHF